MARTFGQSPTSSDSGWRTSYPTWIRVSIWILAIAVAVAFAVGVLLST